jgi:phage shock protein PspC (stress-responsive transcriptional regulator)
MHKVITINLNGNAYQVEESGYDALCAYLNNAGAQLQDNPDRAEIITDLEQAIAERCRSFLGPQKTVVTASEIDQMMQAMGPVDAGDEEAGNAGEAESKKKQESGEKTGSGLNNPKRLYRVRQGKMIEGVCTGLAAYFGIDVTIVRLIAVSMLVISGGGAAVAYLIMMAVIPYAETSEQHAAAYGKPFNTQDFISQAKEHYSEFKKDGEEWKRRAREKRQEWQQSWRHSFRNPHYWRGPVPPSVPPHPLAGITLPIVGIVTAALSIGWVLAVFSLLRTHTIFGWPLPIYVPIWMAIVILIVILQAVTAPMKYVNYVSRYGYGHPLGSLIAMFASTLWLILLIIGVWVAYNLSPEFRDFIQSLPDIWNRLANHWGRALDLMESSSLFQ